MPRRLERLPEVTELVTFVAAADERSIRRAAVRLHLSPAGVAKRLDNLEAVVGRSLLQRGPRGLQLTAEGRDFYQRASRVLDEMNGLLRREPDGPAATLRGVHRLLGRRPIRSTEAILLDTERLLANVLDASSEGVAIVSVQDRVILEVNDAFCTLVGWSREELIGTEADAHGIRLDPADVPESAPLQGELEGRTRTGERLALDFDARRIELSGQEVVLVRLTDRTRELELERRLRTRIERQVRISELGRLLSAGQPVDAIVESVLRAARAELGLGSVDVIRYAENGSASGGSRRLRDAASRFRPAWSHGEVVAQRSGRAFVLCAPLPSPDAVLAGVGTRETELDDDDRAFVRSVTTILAAAFATANELAA